MKPEEQDENCFHGLSRREFVRLAGIAGLAGAAGLSLACADRENPAATTSARVNSPGAAEPRLKIGYLPITDATPLLVGHAQNLFSAEGLQVDKPVMMRGWSEVAEGFLAGTFNLVHLLIPVPIFMRFSQKHPVKIVAWNHMNGSALTVGEKSGIRSARDLGGKQIAVPHWYSMHNILLQLCMREYGIEAVVQDQRAPLGKKQTNLFVMKPPDMPTALASGAIDGYIVAEPFNAAGEKLARGRIIRFTGDVFKNHPCCVAVMRHGDIEKHPEWAQKVVNGLVKAQHWTLQHKAEVPRLLSKDGRGYLPMNAPVIERAMLNYDLPTYGSQGTNAIQHPEWNVSRIGFQPYPFESATREIVKLLRQTRVEGDAKFLANLDPEVVVRDLFDYDMVRKAAAAVGGLQVFEGVDAANPYVRQEVIAV
jgi:NitT/TauT family transport system substrate-binding protein